MAIDTSMYGRLATFNPEMGSGFSKGLDIRNQLDQKKLAEAEREQHAQLAQAQKAAIVQTPDGKFMFDQNAYGNALGALAGQGNKLAAQQALSLGQTMTQQQREQEKWANTLKQQEFDNQYRRDSLASDAANRAEARRERQYLAGVSRQEKSDLKTDSDVQKLSKEVSGVQDATNALDEVERELGFPIDSANVVDGKVSVQGREIDLPGVSIPLLGRVSAYSDKAQNLQSAASKVFNTVLKDRSGAAVTNTELERLKTEFGEGKYNTESQMVAALQRYKRGVQNELRNREAGFRPEVVNRYAEQGGRTSRSSELSARPGDPIRKKSQVNIFKTSDIEWAD